MINTTVEKITVEELKLLITVVTLLTLTHIGLTCIVN